MDIKSIFVVLLAVFPLSTFRTSDLTNNYPYLNLFKIDVDKLKLSLDSLETDKLIDISYSNSKYRRTLVHDIDFSLQSGSQEMVNTGSNTLVVILSDSIKPGILELLHFNGPNNEQVNAIQQLVSSVGEQLVPVYELSREEVLQDNYGFARTFKLHLKPDVNQHHAIEILQCSPLIESVRPDGIQRILNS